jgi:hypothetical protein
VRWASVSPWCLANVGQGLLMLAEPSLWPAEYPGPALAAAEGPASGTAGLGHSALGGSGARLSSSRSAVVEAAAAVVEAAAAVEAATAVEAAAAAAAAASSEPRSGSLPTGPNGRPPLARPRDPAPRPRGPAGKRWPQFNAAAAAGHGFEGGVDAVVIGSGIGGRAARVIGFII